MQHTSLVSEFLEKSALLQPDKVALVCGNQRLTYREIDESANQLANAFITAGLHRGDRVVLHLPNSVELVVGVFAVLKAGGVFVVVNPTTKAHKLKYILADARAKICMTWSAREEDLRSLIHELPTLSHGVLVGSEELDRDEQVSLYADVIQRFPTERPPNRSIDLDLACLIYTSGSTGEPKGVMSDHSNVVFAVHSITTYLENTPDDIILCVLPLSFDYGLYQLLMAFKMGARLVLERGFVYPAQVLQRLEEEKVTGFPGVPTIFSVLLTQDLDNYDLSALQYITNTAAALPPTSIQRIREAFPEVRLYSMYGLTETKRSLYLPLDQLDQRTASVGIAIPGTEVWLENDQGQRVEPGQIGELVVRGRHVMRGYWGDESATKKMFRPGSIPGERVCYTGDLFRTDEDGYLYFVARKDDIIKSRGEKVAPKEVEEIIYRIPGVREAAVIGVPDTTLGEVIKACVVVDDDDLTEVDIKRHCRNYLEDFMVPQVVQFFEELPKTTSGKIKKTGLH